MAWVGAFQRSIGMHDHGDTIKRAQNSQLYPVLLEFFRFNASCMQSTSVLLHSRRFEGSFSFNELQLTLDNFTWLSFFACNIFCNFFKYLFQFAVILFVENSLLICHKLVRLGKAKKLNRSLENFAIYWKCLTKNFSKRMLIWKNQAWLPSRTTATH